MLNPINVEFLDAPNILNDGVSENTLTIGVFNTALPSTAGGKAADLILKKDTSMYFWFITDDLQANMTPERPWGLTSKDLLHNTTVKVKAEPGTWTSANHTDVAQRPDLKGYALTPSGDVTLKPGQFIKVTISGLKSGLPSGPTTAFFSYSGSGIDHQATFGPIQKSPLTTTGQKAGVGTLPNQYRLNLQRTPTGTLHIASDIALGGTDESNLIKFGKDRDYQILHKARGRFNKPTLGLHTDQQDAIGFYTTGWTPLLEVEGGTGNTFIKGNAEIGQKLAVGNDLSVNGNAQVNGALTLKNNAQVDGGLNANGGVNVKGTMNIKGPLQVNSVSPIIYNTYNTGKLQSNNYNKYINIDTKISKNDYIGIVGGYHVSSYDARDDAKGEFAMRIVADYDAGSTLYLVVKIYADQDVDNVIVDVIFIRKELMEIRNYKSKQVG